MPNAPLPGRSFAAHPRSRGEHQVTKISVFSPGGSSPLARGTYRNRIVILQVPRLIPARAGNMRGSRHRRRLYAAHPRSRGEHHGGATCWSSSRGSSPLARGTCKCGRGLDLVRRLIPARAGNILADMGVYPLHQQNRITLKPEPHPGYTINSHS